MGGGGGIISLSGLLLFCDRGFGWDCCGERGDVVARGVREGFDEFTSVLSRCLGEVVLDWEVTYGWDGARPLPGSGFQ